MVTLLVKNDGLTIVPLGNKADAVVDYETRVAKTYKDTGLPIWVVKAQILTDVDTENERSEEVKLKIVSATPPVVKRYESLSWSGDLVAVPWLADGARNVSYSYTLIGSLVPAVQAKGFPAKNHD